jgi:hypothetical protein
MKTLIIKKSFTNGRAKESESVHKLSIHLKNEMALTYVLGKGLKHQISKQ